MRRPKCGRSSPLQFSGDLLIAARWIRALTITPWIEKALAHLSGDAGHAGRKERPRVLAVFERSCYAGRGPDLLLCLGAPDIGRAPLNLLLDLPPGTGLERLGVQKGDLFEREGAALRLGPLRILLDRAEAWTPPRLAPKEMKAAGIRRHLEDLARELGTRENPPGLGDLYRAALWDPEADPPAAFSPLAARALPHARAFSEGLDKRDAALLRRGAGGLIGLGPGLTPSGDDFLGGWLTTLRCVEGRGFGRPELDLAAAETMASAAGKTPLISRALLRCALEGASSESIHHLLNAILSGPDPAGPKTLARAVREALRRGHSSGWDALAGVAWGLRSLMKRIEKAGERPAIRVSANSASP